MTEYALILLGTVLVHSLALTQWSAGNVRLRLPDHPLSVRVTALFIGLTLTVATLAAALLDLALLKPFALDVLRLPVSMLLIAGVAQIVISLLYRGSSPPTRHTVLLTSDALILGVALINRAAEISLVEAVTAALVTSAGFALLLILFGGVQKRIATADIPQPFKGTPILLITAGIISIALMGLSGFR